jgi:DNA-binding beta-propeller fold protein YncE
MKFALAAVLLLGGLMQAQEAKALKLKSRIELANVDGRIDHFSADFKGQRLFMAALGNHTVEVMDIQNGKRLHTITNLAEPQGLYFDPTTNHLFAGCAKDGTTKVYDGSTFQLLETVPFPSNVDNIRYDPRSQHIIVGYGTGALGFLDLNGKKISEIALDGHPESFQLEKSGTRVFVNVPNEKEIQVADLAKGVLIAKWPVQSALRNYPMALDESHRRLLIGCRTPPKMLVIDTETGKQTGSLDIVDDTDDIFYDASKNRVYVIGGGGFVDVFDQKSADQYTRIEHLATAAGARTGFFAPDWEKLFVAVPHRGEQRAEVLIFDTK